MTNNTYRWPELEIVDPSISGPLTVFPIVGGNDTVDDYLLLSVALEKGTATIKEKSKEGSVPVILVHNKGKLPLLGIQGEEYVGSKQNRTLNLSFLVGPGKTEIPVSCVEQGRWADRSPAFTEGAYDSSSIRSAKAAMLHKNILSGTSDKFGTDQSAVWAAVMRLSGKLGTSSPTMALHDVYKDGKVGYSLDEIVSGIELPGEARGAVVAAGGCVIGADIFEAAPVFERIWPRILRSYAIDAFGAKGTPPSLEAAETFLHAPRGSTWVATPSVGMGEDVRWEGKGFIAAALVWKDRLVHGSVFAG